MFRQISRFRRFGAEALAWTMLVTSVAPASAVATPVPAPSMRRIPSHLAAPAPAARPAGAQSAQISFPFFGPKRYTRTAGPPNVFNETIAVPAWLVGPYTLRVQNGEPDGTRRLSAATIVINGVTVASQSDFNQNAAGFDRAVTLTPSTTMRIRLESTPAGYLTLNLAGANADHTPPQVAIVAPVPGSSAANVSPRLVVSYRDLAGAAEPGASGANLSSLKVTLDNVDRTSLFTRGADQASADLAGVAQLTEGVHTLAMSIQDGAGNAASTSAQFRVDLTAPSLGPIVPGVGEYVATRQPVIRVQYQDGTELDLQTLRVDINGTDRTSLFTKGTAEATATLTEATELAEGTNTVSARVRDTAGNEATATSAFIVDVTKPVVAIAQPADGAHTSAQTVDVTGTITDSSAATVTVNGVAAVVTGSMFTAAGLPLGNGPVASFRVLATDAAGNTGERNVSVTVDRANPIVQIQTPSAGKYFQSGSLVVTGTVADDSSTEVSVNGVPATVGGGTFTAALETTDGRLELLVIARDAAGNIGEAASFAVIDSVAPVLTIAAPASGLITNAASVTVTGTASDSSPFAVTAGTSDVAVVNGAFSTARPFGSEGEHTIELVATDAAGNVTSQSVTVTIDRSLPAVQITTPVHGSFIPTAAPGVAVQWSDAKGVNPESLQVLIDGEDRTARLTKGADGAAGTIDGLGEGAHQIFVRVRDRAGNLAEASAAFTVDATPPDLAIEEPADGFFTARATLDVRGTVSDMSAVRVAVNGVDAVVTGNAFSVSGIPAGDAGITTLRTVATDAAGNTRETSIRVNVDRAAPVVRIMTPGSGAYLQGPSLTVTGTVSDVSPHSVDVNGQAAVVEGGTFTVQIPATDGALTIRATATDAAGNLASAEASVTIDTKAPDITLSSPANGTITNQNAIAVTGTISDTAPVTLRVNDAPVVLLNRAFSTTVPLAGDGARGIQIVAVDAAGNSSTHEVTVTRDATPPNLTIVTPAENALTGQHPVAVTGLVQDLTAVVVRVNGVEAGRAQSSWSGSAMFGAEGNQTITVTAVDAAGNQSTAVRNILLDTAAPTVVIDAPAADALTAANSITVRGRVADVSLVSVKVGAVTAAIQAGEFSAVVPLAEGENHLHVVATDALDRVGGAEVIVTRDSTPPSIEMAAPETISRRRGAQAAVTASDSVALERVVVTANGATLGTFTQGQVALDLTAPESLAVGASLVVTATAVDRAGNTATATRSLRVIADGVLVGQAIADDTGLPLRDASVRVGDRTLTTDDRGSYAIPASDVNVLITVAKDGLTTVERLVPVESGVGTAVVDARLTPLGAPVTLDGGAATLTSPSAGRIVNPISISMPAGATAAGTTMRLTQLSPQGLPGLLPLGWSPLAAFDLRGTAAPAPLTATARLTTLVPSTQGAAGALPDAVHLVHYRPSLHAWVMVLSNVPVVDGLASVDLPALVAGLDAPNAFAFVVPDAVEPPIPIAGSGEPLAGVEMATLPPAATSAGAVTPAVLPPAGGTALGLLAIQSPTALPSGTIVQTQVTETFTLATGEVASEETRNQDVVLYRLPAVAAPAVSATPVTFQAALSAHFPITPSRAFAPAQLVQGRVHLDVLAGREAVRGQTGGSEPLTLTSGGITLTVPARARTEDTAISLQPAILSTFLPSVADLQPLAEVMVDLSGATLTMGAELSVSTATLTGVGVSDRFLIARVERIDGVPRLAVVAVADYAGDRIVSRVVFGLPGITIGGRYVLYRAATPFGFAVATVTGGGTPVASALVATDRWPFVARTNAAGNATVAAPEGSVRVSAGVPGTALEGSAVVTLTAEQMTLVPIALNGTVTIASVTPADGSGAVPAAIQIEIATTAPISTTSVETATVRLTTDGADVAVRRVLAGSGRTLAIVPQARLRAATTYRLEVAGLIDIHGSPIAVSPVTFQTLAEAALVFNPENLRVSFPDANGVVAVTATPGSLPSGTSVLIVNAGSGEVVTFTVGNDGSLNGSLSATIDHRLIVTITDPKGQTATFHRTKYVAPDGTTAVGAAGGVIEGAGGIEVRIPEGATDNAVVMKIEPFGADFMTERPAMAPGANFGSGIKIGSTGETHFKKEVDLAFPIPAGAPANPSDAFYYVYRRIQGPNGEVFFETLDNAFVEGTGADARVVTASFPFTGYKDGWNQWNPVGPALGGMGFGQVGNMGTCHAIVMWTHQALLPGRPIGGVIVGKILRPRFEPGATTPVYDGVPGVLVKREDALNGGNPDNNIALTQANGQFIFYDNYFETGTVRIRAESEQGTFYATAFAVAEADSKTVTDDALIALFARGHFQNIAYANITLPPVAPAPPAPQIAIKVFTETDGARKDTKGLVVAGTLLVIGFTAQNGTISGATINGVEYAVRVDPLKGRTAAGGMDAILDAPFTTQQPGSYTITGTALAPFGPPVQSSISFRVIAAGGGTNTTVAGRPGVLSVEPMAGATGVSVATFVNLAFTEPVTQITSESVSLRGPDGVAVPVRMSGIAVDAAGVPTPVETITSSHAVTSLTLIPLVALHYGAAYQVVLTDAIIDRDLDANGNSNAQTLVPFTSTFRTFGPERLGGSAETPRASGLVVLGDRAYLTETLYPGGTSGPNQIGYLRSYDVTNPAAPEEILPSWLISYPPRDIAGEMDADGRRTIVVATSPRTWFFLQGELVYHYDIQSSPSNLFAFDVTGGGAPRWIGAVNLTDNLMDGIPSRIVMKDGMIYAATQNKGVQVVDLEGMRAGFPEEGAPDNDFMRHGAIFKGGYNKAAVVNSVHVMEPADANPGDLNAYHLPLTDLKVEDYVVSGQSKRLVVATGPRKQIGLVVVDPIYSATLWRGPLTHDSGSMEWGAAIATATVAGRPLVLVGGTGKVRDPQTGAELSTGVMAVVDMSPLADSALAAPNVLMMIGLPHSVGDIIVTGQTAIVSGWAGSADPAGAPGVASLVDLTEPTTPRIVGGLSGIGSRMALAGNILYSTERSLFKGLPTPLGGIRTTALAATAVVTNISASGIVSENSGDVSEKEIAIEFAVVPAERSFDAAEVRIFRDGVLIDTLQPTLSGSTGRAVWPAKRPVSRRAVYTAQAIIDPNTERPLQSPVVRVPLVHVTFLDRNGDETFAPLVSDPRPVVTLDPIATRDVTLLGGQSARVRLAGRVTDAVADVVAERAADITQVTINGVTYPVTREHQPTTPSRPYAFRGKFEATVTVSLVKGANVVSVEARNAVGNVGYDTVTVTIDQTQTEMPPVQESVFDARLLDPFVIAAGPVTAEGLRSVFVSRTDTPSSEAAALVETAQGSLVFAGSTATLGSATLSLDAPLGSDAAVVDRTTGRLTSDLAGLDELALELVETNPVSRLFRSAALRLPNNAALSLTLQRPLDPNAVDVMTAAIASSPVGTLSETAPSSRVFSGAVSGLGNVTLTIERANLVPNQANSIAVLIDSSELNLSGFHLELGQVNTTAYEFRSQVLVAAVGFDAHPIVVGGRLVSVEPNDGGDGGTIEPVWIVPSGLPNLRADDRLRLDGQELELTAEPLSGGGGSNLATGSSTTPRHPGRTKEPVLFVRDTGGFKARNVVQGPDAPDAADRSTISPVPHVAQIESPSRNLTVQRIGGSLHFTKIVAIRGAATAVWASWVTDRAEQNDVVSVEAVGQGVSARLNPTAGGSATPISGGFLGPYVAYRVKVPLIIDATKDADIGWRDLMFRFRNGDAKLFRRAVQITRGRVVIFAIDGLSREQFDAAIDSPGPELRLGKTALNWMFRTTAPNRQNIVVTESTTFPPITFTRWASVFSGRPPGETLVPHNQYLNRHAIINGPSFGGADQGLGLGDERLSLFVMHGDDAYNRHFPVDFIYDDLSRRQFRSIVSVQQAGLGKGTPGDGKDNVWKRPGLDFALAYAGTENAEEEGAVLDAAGVGYARDEIRRTNGSFDLMVVYLAGLDHVIHDQGKATETAAAYFRDRLHLAINTIYQSLGPLADSTVFGFFSDHGHYDTNRNRFIDLDRQGSEVTTRGAVMRNALQRSPLNRVGKSFTTSGITGYLQPNIIFDPQFGMASVYVAANSRGSEWAAQPDWTKPPTVDDLEPVVNGIFKQYIAPFRHDLQWGERPIADIIVRVPTANTFGGSRYMVVPRNYDPDRRTCGASGTSRCGLAGQLQEVAALNGLGYGTSFVEDDARWLYNHPTERLQAHISANSGDIILLANGRAGFMFGVPNSGDHGSLTYADSLVPVAFAFPGASGPWDTTLDPIVTFLQSVPYKTFGSTQVTQQLLEAAALRAFFFR